MTRNLGYDKERFIYINESLTETNRKLFRDCMKTKKDMVMLLYGPAMEGYMCERITAVQIKMHDDIIQKMPL